MPILGAHQSIAGGFHCAVHSYGIQAAQFALDSANSGGVLPECAQQVADGEAKSHWAPPFGTKTYASGNSRFANSTYRFRTGTMSAARSPNISSVHGALADVSGTNLDMGGQYFSADGVFVTTVKCAARWLNL